MAMKKMTGAKKPVAKMTSTGSAKKTTVSRGSKVPVQVGNQNQIETTRGSKNYPNKISKAETSTEKKMAKKVGMNGSYIDKKGVKNYPGANEISSSRKAQRAGGKVDTRTAGKSNPTARKKLKGPKGS